MEDKVGFQIALYSGFFLAIPMFLQLRMKEAAYGRHHKALSTQPAIYRRVLVSNRLAWSLMESPALIVPPIVFAQGVHSGESVPRILLTFFVGHYFHRVVVYPLRMRAGCPPNMPVFIVLSAVVFNLYNGYLQGRSLSQYTTYPESWLSSIFFLVGAFVFVSGMGINMVSDYMLLDLRTKAGYCIPSGWLFEYVSCPNYLGEMMEWLGWAILTSCSAGLLFFLLTVANLVPRATSHHRWYQRTFPNYPSSRRILASHLTV